MNSSGDSPAIVDSKGLRAFSERLARVFEPLSGAAAKTGAQTLEGKGYFQGGVANHRPVRRD